MGRHITREEYQTFQTAYNHFNRRLFGGELPQALVTLQNARRARGYYWARRFTNRTSRATTGELALNPEHFKKRSDEQILSTLVHEMVHVWQHAFGHPGRRGYHNREWAEKMKCIGLHPSTTGKRGGHETGERVSHFVVKEGPFARCYRSLKREGFRLTWQATTSGPGEPTRVRFVCHACQLKAYARPTAVLICGKCYKEGTPVCFMDRSQR